VRFHCFEFLFLLLRRTNSDNFYQVLPVPASASDAVGVGPHRWAQRGASRRGRPPIFHEPWLSWDTVEDWGSGSTALTNVVHALRQVLG